MRRQTAKQTSLSQSNMSPLALAFHFSTSVTSAAFRDRFHYRANRTADDKSISSSVQVDSRM
jgi:hypothetical protein